jgi:rhodanese-related sulfurtransferase
MDRTEGIHMQRIFVGWIREAFWVLIILAGLAVAINGLRPDTIPFISMSPITANRLSPDLPVTEIPLAEAQAKHEAGVALFIDARSPEDFQAGHIKGAVNLPDQAFDEVFPEMAEEIEKWEQLVTYCDGRDCVLGHALAGKLYQLGFKNVSYLVNGWTSWRERGLPTEP